MVFGYFIADKYCKTSVVHISNKSLARKILKMIEHVSFSIWYREISLLAFQSGIAKYRCLYTQGVVAFETLRVFFSPGILQVFRKTLNPFHFFFIFFHFSFLFLKYRLSQGEFRRWEGCGIKSM